MNPLSVRIVEATATGAVRVELENNSQKPIRVFRDSNSWGAARWKLLRLKDGRAEAWAQTTGRTIFTRNVPGFDEIPPGGRLDVRLNINDGNWLSSGVTPVRFESGETVVAIYEVPATKESEKFGVWHGIAVAVSTAR
jgi:hypothetical protein